MSAMNIRLVQFSLGPGKRAVAEAIADKVVPAIRAQQGAIDVNSSLMTKLVTNRKAVGRSAHW